MADDYSVFRVPFRKLAARDRPALAAIWVTNRPRLLRLVRDKLLPAWGLSHVGTWYWVKVTRAGEPVIFLDDRRRRTWEPIVVGRSHSGGSEGEPLS
ncbi:MAG: hypothetical protein BJ554DRAFT_3303, partial [Olpidium bornovanus]